MVRSASDRHMYKNMSVLMLNHLMVRGLSIAASSLKDSNEYNIVLSKNR